MPSRSPPISRIILVMEQKKLPPKVLTPYMVNVYRALVILGSFGILIGACGIAILLDIEQKKYWFSHTKFAEVWVMLTEKNAMTTNICFNGGMLAVIVSFLRLQAHANGVALEKSGSKKTK